MAHSKKQVGHNRRMELATQLLYLLHSCLRKQTLSEFILSSNINLQTKIFVIIDLKLLRLNVLLFQSYFANLATMLKLTTETYNF